MKRIVLEHIDGIEIYPIISLIIFVALFAGVIIYAIKLDKDTLKTISALPLENDDNTENLERHENTNE